MYPSHFVGPQQGARALLCCLACRPQGRNLQMYCVPHELGWCRAAGLTVANLSGCVMRQLTGHMHWTSRGADDCVPHGHAGCWGR